MTLESDLRVANATSGNITAHGRGWAIVHAGTGSSFVEEGQPIANDGGSVVYDTAPASATDLILGVYGSFGSSSSSLGMQVLDFQVEHVS